MGWASALAVAGDIGKDFGFAAYGDYRARKAASAQRAWLEKMDNSKHQREVKDLRAAGLNPILSATAGGSLGVPNSPIAHIPDYDSNASAHQARIQNKLAESQIDKNLAESRLAQAQQWNAEYNSDFIKSNTILNSILSSKESASAYGIHLDNQYKDMMNKLKAYDVKAQDTLSGAQSYGPGAKLAIDLIRALSK